MKRTHWRLAAGWAAVTFVFAIQSILRFSPHAPFAGLNGSLALFW